jgi:hypothetical protein
MGLVKQETRLAYIINQKKYLPTLVNIKQCRGNDERKNKTS